MNSRLLFCGDTFLRTRDGGNPFARVLEHFEDAHVCINLETSLKGRNEKRKNVPLSVAEGSLDLIPETVHFVTIVNNHAADGASPFGLAKALEKRGRTVVGPENPSSIHVSLDGLRADFLSAYFPLPRGLSYGGAVARRLEALMRSSDAERRIVNLHWGYEHTDVPSPSQRAIARRLVDAGASIIIGHHPHVPQGWELYRGVPIFYSLGNFNFWQFDVRNTEKNRWGYMVRYEPLSARVDVLPYRINENYQPVPVASAESADLMQRIGRLSEELRSVSSVSWLATCYRNWYAREARVWRERLRRAGGLRLLARFVAWLLLPMQIRFYCHVIAARIRGRR